jgi:hypothetical protein
MHEATCGVVYVHSAGVVTHDRRVGSRNEIPTYIHAYAGWCILQVFVFSEGIYVRYIVHTRICVWIRNLNTFIFWKDSSFGVISNLSECHFLSEFIFVRMSFLCECHFCPNVIFVRMSFLSECHFCPKVDSPNWRCPSKHWFIQR